jgi:hypothetical protein
MFRRAALLIPLVFAAGSARADEWRFCVGVAPASHETVISDIFTSEAEPGRLEHKLEAYFRARRAKALTFQCPHGGDRVAALNGQTTALQFNRTMGYAINGLPSHEVAMALGEDLF